MHLSVETRPEVNRRSRSVKWIALLLLTIAMALAEGQAAAHHSFAMFDFTKVTTFHGVIKEFQWTNPHVILSFTVDAKEGEEPQVWWAELTSPGNLTRVGWSKRAFKAGDRVEITVHPLRDGTHGGAFVKATIEGTTQVWTSDLRAQERPELGLAGPDGGLGGASGGASAPESRKSGCSISPPAALRSSATRVFTLAIALSWVVRRRRTDSPKR
jgi:hypothetical protein